MVYIVLLSAAFLFYFISHCGVDKEWSSTEYNTIPISKILKTYCYSATTTCFLIH